MSLPAQDPAPGTPGAPRRYPHLSRFHALNCTPEENERIEKLIYVLFDVFRVITWAALLVWFHPHVLDYVGGRAIADAILAHGWVRWVVAVPLLPCALLSVLSPVSRPGDRAQASALATTLGGTVVGHSKLDPTYGMPNGPALRVPVARGSVDVRSWSNHRSPITRARARVAMRGGFAFSAHGSGREPALVSSLATHAMRAGVNALRERADDPRARAAAAALEFAATPPVTIGHEALDRALVLRTSDPAAARAMFATAGVADALLQLHASTPRWSWSLVDNGDGTADLTLERPGSLGDAEAVRRLVEPMRAAIEALEAAGIVRAA